MSKRPLEPSNNEGPPQPSPTQSQTAAKAPNGAWGQVGVGGQGRVGGQAPGGPGQLGGQGGGQVQAQGWTQARAGLRSSVVVEQEAQQSHQGQPAQGGMRGSVGGAQTQFRGFSSSMQGSLSSQGPVQLGGLRNSQSGGYQRASGGIPGPPPTKRINTGMTYIRA